MSMNQSFMGDNPQQPGAMSAVYVPDQLIADSKALVSQPVLLAPGTYKRGMVLGMQSVNALEAVPLPVNKGNGILGALSSASLNTGVYTVVATDATHFAVTNPEGVPLGTAAAGSAFASAEISFMITAGSAPFEAGDQFNVTAYDATGLFVKCVRTANDGSGEPVAILADDITTAVPATAGAYVAGEFNINAMTYDTSWSPALLTAALRKYSLFAKGSVSAAPPVNNSAP